MQKCSLTLPDVMYTAVWRRYIKHFDIICNCVCWLRHLQHFFLTSLVLQKCWKITNGVHTHLYSPKDSRKQPNNSVIFFQPFGRFFPANFLSHSTASRWQLDTQMSELSAGYYLKHQFVKQFYLLLIAPAIGGTFLAPPVCSTP